MKVKIELNETVSLQDHPTEGWIHINIIIHDENEKETIISRGVIIEDLKLALRKMTAK